MTIWKVVFLTREQRANPNINCVDLTKDGSVVFSDLPYTEAIKHVKENAGPGDLYTDGCEPQLVTEVFADY